MSSLPEVEIETGGDVSDEVKQAAERLRTIDDMQRNRNFPSPILQISDWQELARAFLAEHNPDTEKENATLLTAEILQASGLNNSFGSWGHSRLGFRLSHNNAHPPYLWSVSGCVDDIGGYLETVGDLRKLLEALHIDATVVVPKGGE